VKSSLRDLFPDVSGRRDRRALDSLISSGAPYELRDHVLANPELVGQSIDIWVSASDDIDMLDKGYIDRDVDSTGRRVTDKQIGWYDKLIADGRLERQFNTTFFTTGRHLGRRAGVILYLAGDPAAGLPAGGDDGGLSGRVRAQEQVD
ncbi:MAG: DUF3333 domain-containing protein, partial [Minwuia sp.]|nr:DUF3333 domain-containing protein [Minwuia sp.]